MDAVDAAEMAPVVAAQTSAQFPVWRGPRLKAIGCWVMPATVGILVGLVASASAQSVGRSAQGSQPNINVPAAIVVGQATQASLPIQVGPQGSVPRNSFLRLRGLPPSVSLTEGHVIGPGSWSVPLVALPNLRVNVPAALGGRAEVTITLVNVDGTVIAEASTSLVIAAPAPAIVAPPEQKQPAPVQLLPVEERARARKLVEQGERYLAMGNLAIARQFFERAADIGYAPGALKLAATFDPIELAQLGARSVAPNLAEARKWYERARELGAVEATERLARLTKNY